MAQRVKARSAKPEKQSSFPRSQAVGEEKPPPASYSLTHTCALWTQVVP